MGRCIAEQTTSAASYAVTLTYAGSGPETAMLRYRDVQLALKLLRRRGFQVRYIVAGEFGSKKGRAHWHAVLFFSVVWVHPKTGAYGPAPMPVRGVGPWDIRIGERFRWAAWPHGFAFFQEPDYGGFAYVLKYALKDQDAGVAKGHLAMSKKPPLGHEFFMALADRHVMQGLAPQDLFYSFSHVFDANKKRRRFLVQGVSRENYLKAFVEKWRAVYGTEPPVSEQMVQYWDAVARAENLAAVTDEQYLARKAQWPKYRTAAPVAQSAALLLHEFEWWNSENWQYLSAVVPSELWDDVPVELVTRFANGEAALLEMVETTQGLNFYAKAERLLSWFVEGEKAQAWAAWWQAENEVCRMRSAG